MDTGNSEVEADGHELMSTLPELTDIGQLPQPATL